MHTHTRTHTPADVLATLKIRSAVKSWGPFVRLSLYNWESMAVMCDFLWWLQGESQTRNPPSAEGVPLWDMPNVLRASQTDHISLIVGYCPSETDRSGWPRSHPCSDECVHVFLLSCFNWSDFRGFLSRNSPLLWSRFDSSCLYQTCTHLPAKCRCSELRNNKSWGIGRRSTSFLASAGKKKW